MAQGFKPSKAGSSSKAKTSSKGPKQGFGRVIAPKKKAAVQQATQKRKQQASLTHKIESDMAGRAAAGGPLSIMKKMGDATNKTLQEEKEKKLAKGRAKGRPQ